MESMESAMMKALQGPFAPPLALLENHAMRPCCTSTFQPFLLVAIEREEENRELAMGEVPTSESEQCFIIGTSLSRNKK